MREIKFRVWNGEQMVSPDYVKRNGFAFWYENSIQTASRELMQYTGLKDKNGVEIYEGDILSDKWKCEVFKDKNTGAYMVRFHTNPEFNKNKTLYGYLQSREKAETAERDCEVIGNIYQNPELLNLKNK